MGRADGGTGPVGGAGPVGGIDRVGTDSVQPMLAFLSPAWLAALHDAASADPSLAEASSTVAVVLEQHVTDVPGAPGGEVRYHLVLDHGSAAVVPGPATDPTIRFTQDLATAVGIASGTDSAQRAFMSGRLQVGGDLRVLVDHPEALASLQDVFARVRARTDLSVEAAG